MISHEKDDQEMIGYHGEASLCPHCHKFHHWDSERLACLERVLQEVLEDNRRLREQLGIEQSNARHAESMAMIEEHEHDVMVSHMRYKAKKRGLRL